MEQYWNNIDEDGESQSDCASLLGGRDDDTFGTQKPQRAGDMTPALEPTPEAAPAKKKRPPRKRKKKKQQQIIDKSKQTEEKNEIKDGNADATNKASPQNEQKIEADETAENSYVDAANKTSSQTEQKIDVQDGNTNDTNITSSTEQKTEAKNGITNATKTAAPPVAMNWETVGKSMKMSQPVAPKLKVSVERKQQNPKEDTWATVGKPKKAVEPTWATVRRKENFVVKEMHKSIPQKSSHPRNPTRQLGVTGASDWRNHTLSRNVSSGTSLRNENAQPSRGPPPISSNSDGWPTLSDVPKSGQADLWPSLSTSSGRALSSIAAPQSTKTKATQGAWMKKGGSLQSTWDKTQR